MFKKFVVRSGISLIALCGALQCFAQTTTKPTPTLITKPDALFFRQTGSTPPASMSFAVTATSGTPSGISASASGGTWLSASVSGTTVTVSVNTASLASGSYSGSVAVSAAGFNSPAKPVAISLVLTGANIAIGPETMNLHMTVGGEADSLSVCNSGSCSRATPKPRSVNIFHRDGAPFSWSLVSNQPWLSTSATSGSGKSTVQVTVDTSKITATGTYTGTITATDTNNGTTDALTVTLTADPPKPPNFQLGPYLNQPGVLNFYADPNNLTPGPRIFYGRNVGGNGPNGAGPLNFTLTGGVNSPAGGNWMTFTPSSNTTPGLTTVSVNAAGLAPGSYSATINGYATEPAGVTGGTLTGSLQVYLKVGQNPAVHLDHHFLRFTASTKQNPPVPSPGSQTVTFVTKTAAGYPYTTSISAAKGSGWISVSPASGTATNGATMTISVVPSAIATFTPGLYTGQVQINYGGGSPVSQQTVGVALRVYGPADGPFLIASPGGMIFVATAGGSNPASKSISVRADGAAAAGLNYTVTAASQSGGNWLSASPTSGTATSTPGTVTASVNVGSLAAGTYKGTITFNPDPTTNAPVQIVNVILIVKAAATGHVVSRGSAETRGDPRPMDSTQTFTPGTLVAVLTDPPDQFTGSTDSAVNLAVAVTDAGGNPITGATVVVSSSNGEPDVTLDDLGTGGYTGIFQPQQSGSVTLTLAVSAMDSTQTLFTSADSTVTGDIQSVPDTTLPVFTDGLVSSATYATQPTPATPGSLMSLFGYNMLSSTANAPAGVFPLPNSLGGATVTFGGVTAPILNAVQASVPGGQDQINLVVPIEMDGQATADIVVNGAQGPGAPQTVPIGVAPGFFTQNASGSGDGLFTHSNGTLVTPSSPATAGETVVLYATGLGDTQTAVADGAADVGANLLTGTYRVTVGGQPATVNYAGLAPTFAGFYQLNVVIPSGLPTGENNVIVFVNGTPATGRATIALH